MNCVCGVCVVCRLFVFFVHGACGVPMSGVCVLSVVYLCCVHWVCVHGA